MTQNDRLQLWLRMKPVYFSRWAWETAVRREPTKYTMYFPVYQGCKVIFT